VWTALLKGKLEEEGRPALSAASSPYHSVKASQPASHAYPALRISPSPERSHLLLSHLARRRAGAPHPGEAKGVGARDGLRASRACMPCCFHVAVGVATRTHGLTGLRASQRHHRASVRATTRRPTELIVGRPTARAEPAVVRLVGGEV
jgi:hypothetical protein